MQRKSKGQATIEFAAIMIFVLGALLIFQKYIVMGISGKWKSAGDVFGHGMIFDPKKTTECIYDFRFEAGYYEKGCYEYEGCACEKVVFNDTAAKEECELCVRRCVRRSTLCNWEYDPNDP